MADEKKYIGVGEAYQAACEGADKWDGGCNPERDARIAESIYAVPAADVRPVVRGRWIKAKASAWATAKYYQCSICGDTAPVGYIGHGARTNFCPNCGADMREGNDGD